MLWSKLDADGLVDAQQLRVCWVDKHHSSCAVGFENKPQLQIIASLGCST